LDFVGFYDAVTRLQTMGLKKDLSWDICAPTEQICDDRGIVYQVNKIKPDLSTYDLIYLPGGMETRNLINVADFITWIKSAQNVKYKVSVCTGSLLVGVAGFLYGKRATTHPGAFELLRPYCREVVNQRIVRDGDIITGGGVATSIDLGIYMCEKLANS